MYDYYMMDILLFSLFLFLIIFCLIRQAKIKRKLIAKSMKELDYKIFVSIPFLIMATLQLNTTIKYFNSILKYNYINDWHHMFNYLYIVKMETYFSKMKIDPGYWAISEYRHSVILFITYLLLSLFNIVLSLRRKVICKDGIYTNAGNYKWPRIKKYEWIDLNTTTSKDNVKYISLYFICVNSNRIKSFDKTTEISFKIASYDREKVNLFLRKVLPSKEIN